MKRWIGFILIFCMVLSMGLLSYADNEATITQNPCEQPIDVNGAYEYLPNENMHYAPSVDGGYAVQTEQEEIRVIPKDSDAAEDLQLVVHFFDDENEEAQEWLKECIKGLETASRPFEIYYTSGKNSASRVELGEGDEISLKLPDAEKEYVVIRLAYDGSKTVVDSTVKDGYITFFAGGTKCYFALAEKSETDLPIEPDQPDQPDQPCEPDQPDQPTEPDQPTKPDQKPDSPDTGNGFDLIFWIAIAVASASALAIALLLRKKEEE